MRLTGVGGNREADALGGGHDGGVDPDDRRRADSRAVPPEFPGLIDASVWMKFS